MVYLACLKLGSASIWDISETSGVKRTTCYVVMDDLISKGMASLSRDKKRTVYDVITPNELFFNIKNKQNQFAESISELNALSSQIRSKPNIRMFEGIEGVKQAYDITLSLTEGSEFIVYGTPDVFYNYTDMMQKYLKNRLDRKIRVRAISPDKENLGEITKNNEKELRQTRVLPQNIFDQRTEVCILPDKIIYIAHSEEKPFATVIENLTLATEEKNRFEILWSIAK
jgi:sugar-specific transcriptional regulator TrmB